jgi:hypothetical protein
LLVVPVCDDRLHVDDFMLGDFLDDFTVAMAWVPTGSPEDAFDLVYREYVGFAHEDFSLYLAVSRVRAGVVVCCR